MLLGSWPHTRYDAQGLPALGEWSGAVQMPGLPAVETSLGSEATWIVCAKG